MCIGIHAHPHAYSHRSLHLAAVVLTVEQYAGVVGVMDMEKKKRILREVRERGGSMVSDKAANRFPVLSLMDGKVCVCDGMHSHQYGVAESVYLNLELM